MQTKSKSLSATWSFCLMAALSFFLLSPLGAAENEPVEPSDVSDIGTLSGFVVNVANGTFLNGVEVRTRPSAGQAVSNLDGIFHMDVPAGTYELEVRKEGYVPQIIRGIKVAVGETAFQDVALNPEVGVSLGEVTVVAEADQASEAGLLVERKSAPTVRDAIGAQEMSRMVGSDASDVMQRVTGVSIVDNKYVYIRGLGERYGSTMLNGAVVPSTRPDKKVVPMDLFPAALMQNIRTEKSYTPDQPGEFSGGLVKMNTVDFPRSPILKLSYGTSFGSTTTFKDFADYPGGSRDWLGFDDGTRSLPSGIPNQRLTRRGRFSTIGFTSDELQGFGQSFSNVWTPQGGQNAIPNQSFNFMAGNTFGKLGVVLALSHGNKWHRQEESRNYCRSAGEGKLSPLREYEMDFSTRSILTGITANFAYELTDNNRIQFQNFFSKDTSDESRFFEGFDSDGQQRVRNQRIRMIEEDVGSTKVSGEHYLTALGNSFLTWRLSYSLSTLDEPDLREALYEERNDRFLLADESQSGFRLFNDLDENIWEPGLDWTTYFNRGIVNSSIKVGASYRSRQRDFLSRRFRFVPLRQDKSDADNGFEFDSNGEANDLLPRFNPTISKVTLVGGNPGAGSDEESDIGMLVREGTAGQIYNSIVIGFGREAVVIDQEATTRQIDSGDLVIANNIFGPNRTRDTQRSQFAAGSDAGGYGVDAWIRGASQMNRFADSASGVGLADPFNALSPDFRPLPNSMALDVNYVKTLPEDGFFTPVTYAGCVGPNDDWTHSWSTSEPSLASGN